MNLTFMRMRHTDLNIGLAVREIVERGLKDLLEESKAPGRKSITEKQLYAVIEDIAKARAENYNYFRAIIKRCL